MESFSRNCIRIINHDMKQNEMESVGLLTIILNKENVNNFDEKLADIYHQIIS